VPEVLEVEMTRRGIEPLIGRRIVEVIATDALIVDDGVDTGVPGARIERLDRRGKLLVLRTDRVDVGIHLGMTGRLFVDEEGPLGPLAYGSATSNGVWDRWAVALDDGRRMRLHDPRRLGRVIFEPTFDRLGPDALTLTRRQLAAALRDRRAPLKAVLLDQARIAGLGNLLVDEALWWAGLAPTRAAGSLDDAEIARLHGVIRRRLVAMMRRGGSHTGRISPALRTEVLRSGRPCPRCGAALVRTEVGGRGTIWCPVHQH
jgi:formamidopyrimidine-DNA glycosylase